MSLLNCSVSIGDCLVVGPLLLFPSAFSLCPKAKLPTFDQLRRGEERRRAQGGEEGDESRFNSNNPTVYVNHGRYMVAHVDMRMLDRLLGWIDSSLLFCSIVSEGRRSRSRSRSRSRINPSITRVSIKINHRRLHTLIHTGIVVCVDACMCVIVPTFSS